MLPPALRGPWPEIAACLGCPADPEAVKAQALSPRVFLVETGGTGRFVVKLAAPHAPVKAEARYLDWLSRQRCDVPRVLAVANADDPAWLALEWCGGTTLDEVLQHASPVRSAALGRALARSLGHVESALAPFTDRARADTSRWQAQTRALVASTTPWIDAAHDALGWLTDRPPSSQIVALLRVALGAAVSAEPDVGSLDYNASNVVVAGAEIRVVDWPALGFDWPERRFVQYGTATGVSLGAAGTFATAITPSSVRRYAGLAATHRSSSQEAVSQTVDAHDVLLLLMAAASLQMIASGSADQERATAWPNVPERRRRLRELLTRRLCKEGPAERFRAQVRRLAQRRFSIGRVAAWP